MLFPYFHKGSRDTSERVVDSHMQIRFIACSYPIPFSVCKRVVDSLLKCLSITLLKGFAYSLHYWYDSPLAFARPLGKYKLESKIGGATKKITKPQRHLSKYRSTHPHHLQPVSISWDSPLKELYNKKLYLISRETVP